MYRNIMRNKDKGRSGKFRGKTKTLGGKVNGNRRLQTKGRIQDTAGNEEIGEMAGRNDRSRDH